MKCLTLTWMLIVLCARLTIAGDPLQIASPGFSPSQVDERGRLVEDWGTVDVRLRGEGVAEADVQVAPLKLDDVIPAACVMSNHGAVEMIRTMYRAPIFPAGVDVLRVQLKELQGKPLDVVLALDTSAGTQLGQRTARIGGRTVLVLPREVIDAQSQLDWGYSDEAVSLPGWGKPKVECDAAFRNIRAGMGGVPIVYRFAVPAGSTATVVLGLCESHWNAAGQRPLRCRAEGAAEQAVDPVAKWGQHQPGLLVFQARDEDGDGKLSVIVRPAAHCAGPEPDPERDLGFCGRRNTGAGQGPGGPVERHGPVLRRRGWHEGSIHLPAGKDGVPPAPGGRWHPGTDVPGRLSRQ